MCYSIRLITFFASNKIALNIKYLQFTVSSRFFVALLPYPLPVSHVNVPWSFFDRLGIVRFDPATTDPPGFIQ